MRRVVLSIALVLCVAGCTSGNSPAPRPEESARVAVEPESSPPWVDVPLAGEGAALPRVIARDGDSLVVAGEVDHGGGAYAPAAWTVKATTVTPIVLRPSTPYGPTADLTSVALVGDTITALGERGGGAHGIPRYTAWSGTAADGLADLPQPFETFGGPASLGLADTAVVDNKPVLVGNWTQKDKFAGPALWQLSGKRWTRSSPQPGIESTERAQNLATALGALGDRPVVLGQSTVLDGSPHVVPMMWIGRGGRWVATPLGASGAPLDLSCGESSCVAATLAGDRLSVWQVSTNNADGDVVSALPTHGWKGTWAQVAVGPDGSVTVAWGPESTVSRWNPGNRSWHSVTGPDARVRDLVTTDDAVVAITGDGDAESAPRHLVTAPLP